MVLSSYLASKIGDEHHYYVCSPVWPFPLESLPSNMTWIRVNTLGVFTAFFALFGSLLYVLRFRCHKIISFSNVNLCIGIIDRVTYFHNLLIITDGAMKYKLLRFAIKYFNQMGQTFVFQTEYVKREFIQCFSEPGFVRLCWPGVREVDTSELSSWGEEIKKILVPITDIENENKNFELLKSVVRELRGEGITFIVTAESKIGIENMEFVGKVGTAEYDKLLDSCDAVMVLSYYETVGLPIFEALSVKKYAIVYQQGYVNSFYCMFGNLDGLLLFSTIDELKNSVRSLGLISSKINNESKSKSKFVTGNWEF